MHFTGDINLGNILTILTLIGIAIGVGRKLGLFESTLREHSQALIDTARRLNAHEERILDVVGSLQRLVGQSDVLVSRSNRDEIER